jgi:hypothetical protein
MKSTSTVGDDLMKKIRIGFIEQGTSFNAWCIAHNVSRTNATQAIYGAWNGPKGREMRERIMRAAGILKAA